MSTSDFERTRQSLVRGRKRYFAVAVGCAVFSIIYEVFSHGVWSNFMLGLFLFPLILGVLPCSILLRSECLPGPAVRSLWNSGAAALTAGSCVAGILEIYGTTSAWLPVYWIAGAGMLVSAAAGLWLAPIHRKN